VSFALHLVPLAWLKPWILTGTLGRRQSFLEFLLDDGFYSCFNVRYAFATLALQAGMNPKVVSEALGHSSVTITLDTYSHVLPNMQDELAIAVENLLKRG
jgi:integrase